MVFEGVQAPPSAARAVSAELRLANATGEPGSQSPLDARHDPRDDARKDQRDERQGGRRVFSMEDFFLRDARGDNAENDCGAAEERECVVKWSLHLRDGSGSWWRIFNQPSARQRPLPVSAESKLCTVEGFDGRYVVKITTNTGREILLAKVVGESARAP
jgi:hypothetical protein